MKRWYLTASVLVALSCPAALLAQNTGGTGFSGGSPNGGGGGGAGGGASGSSTGLAGTANTTLLGNQVDLNFNSVFGTSATIANTTANPFAAYQPTGSSTGNSGTFAGGTGSSGLGTGSGGLAGGLGGSTANRSSGLSGGGLSSGGLGGSLGTGGLSGGGLNSGGLGGNRGGLGGGLNSGSALGGNRNTMGGGNLVGGFQGGAGSFLGGMNNQQNSSQATMGYQVNYNGQVATQTAIATTVTPNADFQQRLASAPGMQSSSGLQVFTTGNTAILRGKVGSDYAKQLAAAMIRLEPGVYDVQNELVVAPPKQ